MTGVIYQHTEHIAHGSVRAADDRGFVELIVFTGIGAVGATEDVCDRLNAVLDAARQQYRDLVVER